MAQIPVIPTAVTNLNRVHFVGSPLHITVDEAGHVLQNARIKLWVWNGNLTTPYTNDSPPTKIFEKEIVSSTDDYIVFEIGDVISSYIDPIMTVDTISATTNSEGVYFQYETIRNYTNPTYSASTTSATMFATLGYNWNYEGEQSFAYNHGSFGFLDAVVNKYYSPYINYYESYIQLSGATNSDDMIGKVLVNKPREYTRCSPDQYIFIYLNKMGLWDTFTPSGKVTVSSRINREDFNRTYRRPQTVDLKTSHQTKQYNINEKQSYIINTGALTEEMGMLVEELLLSRKVYLVKFTGRVVDGFTVDTTETTADNAIITVDYIGIINYANFSQIPVVITDTDFGRKTRLNDKNKISYNIKVEESTYKINNIR